MKRLNKEQRILIIESFCENINFQDVLSKNIRYQSSKIINENIHTVYLQNTKQVQQIG